MEELFKQAQQAGGEGFDLTSEESEQLTRAFDDPEFRKLFGEYMEDMQSPQFRQESEGYLRELEAQQQIPEGKKLIRPTAKFVVKARRKLRGKREKIFVNVVEHESIDVPKAERKGEGQQWSVPYSLGPVRMEKDKSDANAPTYDCCFHPDALRYAQNSKAFRELLIKVALDGVREAARRQDQDVEIEAEFHILKNVTYKSGQVVSMMLGSEEKPAQSAAQSKPTADAKKKQATTKPNQTPTAAKQPVENTPKESAPVSDAKPATPNTAQLRQVSTTAPVRSEKTPEYKIVERGKVDIGGHMEGPMPAAKSTRPNELVVVFELPKVDRAAGLDLDVAERTVKLTYNDVYDVSVSLPYPVFGEQGAAKFDKAKKTLTVTMPVQPLPTEPSHRHGVAESHAANDKGEEHDGTTEGSKSEQPQSPLPIAKKVDHSRWVQQASNSEMDPAIEAAKAAAAANPTLPKPPQQQLQPAESKATTPAPELEILRAPFEFRQNQRTIAVLIQVQGVQENTVHVQYAGRKIFISFLGHKLATQGDMSDITRENGLCAYWQCLELAGDVDEQQCKVDVAEQNMLLALTKANQGFWGITPGTALPPASTSSASMAGVIAEGIEEPSDAIKAQLRTHIASGTAAVQQQPATQPAAVAAGTPTATPDEAKPRPAATKTAGRKPKPSPSSAAKVSNTNKPAPAPAAAAPSLQLKTDMLFELD